ncbi:hypothetical protein NQ317_018598 [Molorchus minor]|uniref:MPN domain-containing protein n=1 Tax=Molorchus minor TaxID=1323400 RepID=A0ABQ9JJG9_9CUCU|nr:hypothetical protein NQ317_018598 [Molorchus minor]
MRYYRSGIEMVRMANVYYEEGSLENSYVLYLKFMTLFLEKIRKHPDFNTVPIDVKGRNQAKLREILPKAEILKKQLLAQYQDDYNRYLSELLTIPRNLDTVSYPDSDSNVPSAKPSAPPPSTDRVLDLPTFDRTNKPSEISFQERFNDNILRRVVIPVKVMTLFQTMASINTCKNVETCGVLTGKLEKNELIITHMILPKQNGTSDSCSPMNEEEIFDYQDQHNLITLGWIHTHPTQTAFLSSVDLHTHCPYQLLMPEAIAIVCSPKYNQYCLLFLLGLDIFIILLVYGLQYIANCRKTGFHPHPTDPPLYREADHVRLENKAPLEVLDLRTV